MWLLYNAISELADLLVLALLALFVFWGATLVVADLLELVAVVIIISNGESVI
ncbi:MAG: hypothetical protein ACK56W_23025 [Pirellula sp.]|jgi:hypothetical protein|nr:hypothetical protein [Pirellula sp.]